MTETGPTISTHCGQSPAATPQAVLQLRHGLCSRAGIKPQNEDSALFHWPQSPHLQQYLGAVAALADGVSSAEAGALASHTATGQFVRDYYKVPDTWSVAHAGQKILASINSKLYRKSHDYPQQEKGFLCTFSALVFKSRTAHCFHIGDSRIYHLRSNTLKCLTRDHNITLAHRQQMLSRALGMDTGLQVDYGQVDLADNDMLLITSDGVHDFIDGEVLRELLADTHSSEQEKAETLVRLAEENGSDDNLSALVVRVQSLPQATLDDYSRQLTRLPFPPELEPGMVLDGYRVERELFSSQRSQLYLVCDTASGETLVMKTPSVNYEDDIHYIDRFVQEEWIGLRIHSEHVVRLHRQERPRSTLYYLMEYVDGITLETWIARNRFPKPAEAFRILKQVAAGLQAFHDQETIHQDLKPANIMVDGSGQVKIIDFGSVYIAGSAEIFRPLEHPAALGTASYSDPHYILGHNSGIRGDIYALATIAYEMFTGELPYGEEIEACRSNADYERLRYRSATQFNPVVPLWFDRALERGCSIDLEQRYPTLEALIRDLGNPNPDYLREDPTDKGDASLFWKILCGIWVITLLAVVALFSSGT
ncbi:bifunctional protein-serine/threonine kinase/phosphatase [Microbulbifer sp. 2205BS26-8]|uniref:bifunctional protein-serine/threonine kinase/phosphatase n=1 Tax=Microbulbifer sp. 2205BS26-8 TaxID=3064386 RepID=UPI00273E3FAF|nr:bifunctional protein-serine/threonine kinase/phosphatase [Microbulbifer sp. 2205BS26-8]MDP5208226.1 bifunctional protein-serine/threonine kinase/phosphatase [Microbulbifer sp. 2205BS26-8]